VRAISSPRRGIHHFASLLSRFLSRAHSPPPSRFPFPLRLSPEQFGGHEHFDDASRLAPQMNHKHNHDARRLARNCSRKHLHDRPSELLSPSQTELLSPSTHPAVNEAPVAVYNTMVQRVQGCVYTNGSRTSISYRCSAYKEDPAGANAEIEREHPRHKQQP
jgi:hypothetical protein